MYLSFKKDPLHIIEFLEARNFQHFKLKLFLSPAVLIVYDCCVFKPYYLFHMFKYLQKWDSIRR